MAPQSGYLSNFCQPVGNVIEPMDAHRFQRDPCGPLTRVHGGHPVRTRLELAERIGVIFRHAPLTPAASPRG